jgi:hypothetical protein
MAQREHVVSRAPSGRSIADHLEALRHRTRYTAEELRGLLPMMPAAVAHRVATLASALEVYADDAERLASLDLPTEEKSA